MPPTKRRRVTPQEPPKQDKHAIFTQWSKDRGVVVGAVEPSVISGRGVGLITTAKIKKDEQIVFVPEKAMFKPSPSISMEMKKHPSLRQPSPSPQACLALSIMSACVRNDSSFEPESPYVVWKETWPTREDFESSMPLFWSGEMCDHLPESVQQPLSRMREDYTKDLAVALSLPTLVFRPEKDIERDFKYYWAIVNSRSFHFKPPGARPGHMVLCPFIDYMNHGPTGTGVKVSQTPKGYEVKADRDYGPGEEILATYGSHPNDKLLVHYGFVNSTTADEPSDDDIRLDEVIIDALNPNTRPQLQDVGMLGSYALSPPSAQRERAELCFKTQVAIRAELLTANEWEYFMLNGEDMTSDQSWKVAMWLKPKLRTYYERALGKLAELGQLERTVVTGSSDAGAVFWLKIRWRQIEEALGAWLSEVEG